MFANTVTYLVALNNELYNLRKVVFLFLLDVSIKIVLFLVKKILKLSFFPSSTIIKAKICTVENTTLLSTIRKKPGTGS